MAIRKLDESIRSAIKGKICEQGCWNCRHADGDINHPSCEKCILGIDDGWEAQIVKGGEDEKTS